MVLICRGEQVLVLRIGCADVAVGARPAVRARVAVLAFALRGVELGFLCAGARLDEVIVRVGGSRQLGPGARLAANRPAGPRGTRRSVGHRVMTTWRWPQGVAACAAGPPRQHKNPLCGETGWTEGRKPRRSSGSVRRLVLPAPPLGPFAKFTTEKGTARVYRIRVQLCTQLYSCTQVPIIKK